MLTKGERDAIRRARRVLVTDSRAHVPDSDWEEAMNRVCPICPVSEPIATETKKSATVIPMRSRSKLRSSDEMCACKTVNTPEGTVIDASECREHDDDPDYGSLTD